MRAVNFIKIDLIKSKMHVISMFLLGALGCVMASESGMIADIAYMLFVVGVMQGAVFVNDRKSDTGLLHLLPATDRDRVLGRTLTGFVLTLIGVINILGCRAVFGGRDFIVYRRLHDFSCSAKYNLLSAGVKLK